MEHGGARPGAGRKPGAVNQIKKDLSVMARAHCDAALAALVQIATSGESEAARVSAANAILDRGFGKPVQAMEHSGPDGEAISITQIRRVIIDPLNPDT